MIATFWGATRYEFRMQIRRPAVWITYAVFTAIAFVLYNQAPNTLNVVFPRWVAHYPLLEVLANWAANVNALLPICFGALLADRLPRDRRTHVDELLTTYPASNGARLAGKYLGTLLATLLPFLLVYLAGAAYISALAHNAGGMLLALVPFAAIVLPGVCFVTAFSLALPAVLPVPLYIIGFVGYWYWNSLWFHSDLPNLGQTLLSPIGAFPLKGFFGEIDDHQLQHPEHLTITAAQAAANIAILLAIALLVMLALDRFMQWQAAHR
jgi:ABC-2 type transport system permease protein